MICPDWYFLSFWGCSASLKRNEVFCCKMVMLPPPPLLNSVIWQIFKCNLTFFNSKILDLTQIRLLWKQSSKCFESMARGEVCCYKMAMLHLWFHNLILGNFKLPVYNRQHCCRNINDKETSLLFWTNNKKLQYNENQLCVDWWSISLSYQLVPPAPCWNRKFNPITSFQTIHHPTCILLS